MAVSFSRIAGWLGLLLGGAIAPRLLCSGVSGSLFAGDRDSQEARARAVDAWVERGFGEGTFSTGSTRFDEEWMFGTYQMAALGFGQVALEHPEDAPVERARMERAIDRMLAPAGHAFDTAAWPHEALSALEAREGHGAFLGYANLVLGLHRRVFGASKYGALNDAVTAALVHRFEDSPTSLIETYPGEIYPVDNAAAIASIALHARDTGRPEPIVPALLGSLRRRCVDGATGLLFQSMGPDGRALDAPRGSGTALGAYFLSFADQAFSRALHVAVQRELSVRLAGFRAIREYPPSITGGPGDIDSGPIVFGLGLSATGFAMAGCRIHGDETCYRELSATANLFGVPFDRGEAGRTYVSGGPLGDAILFAMQTAARAGVS